MSDPPRVPTRQAGPHSRAYQRLSLSVNGCGSTRCGFSRAGTAVRSWRRAPPDGRAIHGRPAATATITGGEGQSRSATIARMGAYHVPRLRGDPNARFP